MPADSDDASLVEAWRAGSAEAAREVVARHGPVLMRVALALCPDVEDAEEAVQEALLRTHRSIETYEPARGTLRAWLVAVTANCARQARRGRARYGGFLARIRREPYVVHEPPVAHRDLAFARQRLAALPRREREAFVLVEIEELTSSEAARVMGVAASTVRVLAARARARLQQDPEDLPAGVARAEGRGR